MKKNIHTYLLASTLGVFGVMGSYNYALADNDSFSGGRNEQSEGSHSEGSDTQKYGKERSGNRYGFSGYKNPHIGERYEGSHVEGSDANNHEAKHSEGKKTQKGGDGAEGYEANSKHPEGNESGRHQ